MILNEGTQTKQQLRWRPSRGKWLEIKHKNRTEKLVKLITNNYKKTLFDLFSIRIWQMFISQMQEYIWTVKIDKSVHKFRTEWILSISTVHKKKLELSRCHEKSYFPLDNECRNSHVLMFTYHRIMSESNTCNV